MALLDVHMFTKLNPVLMRHFSAMTDEIGPFLIKYGLLSMQEYFIIQRGVYVDGGEEILRRLKRAGPNSFYTFLKAVQDLVKVEQRGYHGLWETLQSVLDIQGEQLLKRNSSDYFTRKSSVSIHSLYT